MFVYYWLSQYSRRKADRKFYGKDRDPPASSRGPSKIMQLVRGRVGIRARPVRPPKQRSCLSAARPAPATKDHLRAFVQFPVPSPQAVSKDHLREMHRGADWGESWKWGDTSQVAGWLECCGDLDADWGDPVTDPGQGNSAIVQLLKTGRVSGNHLDHILYSKQRPVRMAARSQVRVLSEAAWGLQPRAPYLAGLFSVQKSFLNKSRWFLVLFLNIQNPLHISLAHQGQRKSVVSDRYLKFLSPSHSSQSCS